MKLANLLRPAASPKYLPHEDLDIELLWPESPHGATTPQTYQILSRLKLCPRNYRLVKILSTIQKTVN